MSHIRTLRSPISLATLAGILAAGIALSGSAQAAEPKVLGTFRDWNAFSFVERGQTVCYVSSQPKSTKPDGVRRGNIHVLITHRPADKALDVVSIIFGYPLRKDSEPVVEIGGTNFQLFSDNETGWARDAQTDARVVAAMVKGATMTVKAASQRGTQTTDSYSLSGLGQAYAAINKECKVQR